MRSDTKSETIRKLVRGSGKTRAEIAKAIGVSLATLNGWMAPDDNRVHRTPPAMAIKLLEQILGRGDEK